MKSTDTELLGPQVSVQELDAADFCVRTRFGCSFVFLKDFVLRSSITSKMKCYFTLVAAAYFNISNVSDRYYESNSKKHFRCYRCVQLPTAGGDAKIRLIKLHSGLHTQLCT